MSAQHTPGPATCWDGGPRCKNEAGEQDRHCGCAGAEAEAAGRVKVVRTCPRCRNRAYQWGNDKGIANRIACVNCGHEWQGRIRRDEQRAAITKATGEQS